MGNFRIFQIGVRILAFAITALAISACADSIQEPEDPALAPAKAGAYENLSLSTSSGDWHDCTVASNSDGSYTITTSGSDPYFRTTKLGRTKTFASSYTMISFEYQATSSIDYFKMYFCPPEAESTASSMQVLKSSSTWKQVDIDISKYRDDYGWANSTFSLFSSSRWYIRFNVTGPIGNVVKIRNLRIREKTADEEAQKAESDNFVADKQAFANRIDNYLNTNFSSTVQQVEVTKDEVVVRGITSGQGRFALAEITPYENITEMETFPHLTAIRGNQFSIRLPRIINRDGYDYDRLLSKWAIVSLNDNVQTLASHARYADKVAAIRSPQPMTPKSKKGLLGYPTHTTPDGVRDLTALNCGIACNGFHLDEWLMTKPLATTAGVGNPNYPAEEYTYGGRKYYISGMKIREFDGLISNYCAQGMQVIMYIAIWTTSTYDSNIKPLLIHPECNGGYQLMPNTTSPDAINAYAAIMTYLAERYSRSDAMRVHHWVAHNEVNAQEIWCNMGSNQPQLYFSDTYMKSMRLIYNITRQYDQNAATMTCFEHNWAAAQNNDASYAAASILSDIKRYCAAEGDFWWGLGHHPYPYNLNVARFWDSSIADADINHVNFTQSTPQVTFYNLEVLQDWAYRPENMYQGTKKRVIYLCEQGLNTPDYSETSLTNQAAGVCWLWKKVNALSAIDGITYYAWQDHTGDGALRLGLRKYSDSPYNSERKPSWYVWQAAGTATEDEVFAPYLSVCGLSDWSQVLH
ncbi:MAG: hypothetical protein IJ626_01945 [Muribaculaceae bacterium]|nr:hypothetical protein [Muribaculaceae bacterium]